MADGAVVRLKGSIRAPARVTGSVRAASASDAPVYAGEYGVTPRAEAQVLECAGMRMSRDVEVSAIPFSRVGSDEGGYTVTIGS